MGLFKELKILINEYKINPSKRMGQNFLIENSALEYIKNTIAPNKDKSYIEIGPGFLFLTKKVAQYAKEIIAIEKDKRFEPFYRENTPENVKIIINDALKENFSSFAATELFGNIPYNISTDLLIKIANEKNITRSVLLLQKEFAMRLLALPGSKTYSAITVFIDFFFEKKFLKTFPPHFFYPRPKISSTLIEIRKKRIDETIDTELLFKIVRTAFGKRRKKIINPLSEIFGKEKALEAINYANIPESARAENLDTKAFLLLYEFFKKY